MKHLRAALALSGVLLMGAPAVADEWPSRPVRMVNTFAAGGTADVLTRLVADQLSATFKQQFYVETRAGAGGTIGVKSVADSPPDGYNFALTNASLLVLQPMVNSEARLRPEARSDQHRHHRRLAADRGGERAERRQDAEGIHRPGEDQPQAADLFVVRRRQLRSSVRRKSGASRRHQDRARALQGRRAGPDRSRRRPHRVLGADRVVGGGAGSRRHAAGAGPHRQGAAARLPRRADLQGTGLRHGRDCCGSRSRDRRVCRRTSPRRSTPRSIARCRRPKSRRGCAATA